MVRVGAIVEVGVVGVVVVEVYITKVGIVIMPICPGCRGEMIVTDAPLIYDIIICGPCVREALNQYVDTLGIQSGDVIVVAHRLKRPEDRIMARQKETKCPNCGVIHLSPSGNKYCSACSKRLGALGDPSFIDSDGNLYREEE